MENCLETTNVWSQDCAASKNSQKSSCKPIESKFIGRIKHIFLQVEEEKRGVRILE